ncbi:Calcium-transporting P-type ATPase, subfamily IIB [Artemisia annua]|uniref:P-type Ca(2+) transporter n=1 Tax=Artemisia annua TaxID=35608 RepID=A0A2U1PRE5_ARTAN|nr:Calcium-transporting P-type ATPase, subfamily IIB [Artemisia annua]
MTEEDIEAMQRNRSTVDLTKARNRWCFAYFSNYFLTSVLSLANFFNSQPCEPIAETVTAEEAQDTEGIHTSNAQTPLRSRLLKLKLSIGKVGLAVAFLKLLVIFIHYYTGYTRDGSEGTIDILNTVTRDVVAIPQGLSIAVTIILFYSAKRMMADKIKVRKLSDLEIMGSTTVICTNKTGTLTTNQMNVSNVWVGFDHIEDTISSIINPQILELFRQAVALSLNNIGSATEKAIMSWAISNLDMDIEKVKQDCTILHVEKFNSKKMVSGVYVWKKKDNTLHEHWKGAAELLLEECSYYYQKDGVIKPIDPENMTKFENVIKERQQLASGIVGIKDPCRPGAKEAIDACRSAGVEIKMITGDNVFTAKAIATECGILEAVPQVCKSEVIRGLVFRNYTNEERTEKVDSIKVMEISSRVCKSEVIQGEVFRNYTNEERMEKVDNIKVMARSSPSDKLLLVQCLKKKGHVVAVTGDGTNDAPALEEADIGLSMGILGTAVAKESLDFIILDDNFASVLNVLSWGRCVYNNIQKFVQFQLTVNVAALFINLIASTCFGGAPLTAIRLLWVNLMISTLGALALATDRPTKDLMHKPPMERDAPLVTNVMWRNLLAQSVFQIIVVLIFKFGDISIFSVDESVNNSLIFNTFVLCQVFNLINSRKLEKKNVFEGLHKDWMFMGIIGVIIILQVVVMEFLNKVVDTEILNAEQWGICIAIAALSWLVGLFVKMIPIPERPYLSYKGYFE